MKITVAQALATVVQLNQTPVDQTGRMVWTVPWNGTGWILGDCESMTMDQAIWKAIETIPFAMECNFAIFPIGTERGELYMEIEREMLRQEAYPGPDEEAGPMWKKMGTDPRELVTFIMEQMRTCATNLTNPKEFRTSMLRAGCLVLASLQWIADWIERLTIRQEKLKQQPTIPPRVVPGSDEAIRLEVQQATDAQEENN